MTVLISVALIYYYGLTILSLKYNIFSKYLLCSLILFTLGILFSSTVHAENEITQYSLVLDIAENNTATVQITFQIQNTDSTVVITGQELLFPFPNVSQANAYLDDQPISAQITTSSLTSKIDLDFSNIPIRNGEIKNIRLSFLSEHIIQDMQGIKVLHIHGGFKNDIPLGSLEVIYPTSIGDISFFSTNPKDIQTFPNGKTKMTLDINKPVLVMWGNQYTIDVLSSATIAKDDKLEERYFAYNLIPNTPSQNVSYAEILNSNYGLYDTFNNYYALLELANSTEIGFTASVTKVNTPLAPIDVEPYNITFQSESKLGQQILQNTKTSQDALDKMQSLYTFLVTKTNISQNQKVSTDPEIVWDKSIPKDSMSSFEYCYVITSFAEELGLKAKINYGYLTLPVFQNDPHFWCEIQNEDTVYLIDIYMHKVHNIRYFGSNSDFDRILVGTWHPSGTQNNALGLFSETNFLQLLSKTPTAFSPSPDNSVIMSLEAPQNAYSGLAFELTAYIQNNSNYFIPITTFSVDGISYIEELSMKDTLLPALLPMQKNVLPTIIFKKNKVWDQGEFQITVSMDVDSETISVEDVTQSITFQVDKRIIITGSLVGVFFIVLILGLLFTFFRWKSSQY